MSQRFGLPPKGFDKSRFQLPSTGYVRTELPIEGTYAGHEARAERGATAVGDALVVRFQDDELSDEGIRVWLTVENRGDRACRWFGCTVMS